jgi:hypothetical protein
MKHSRLFHTQYLVSILLRCHDRLLRPYSYKMKLNVLAAVCISLLLEDELCKTHLAVGRLGTYWGEYDAEWTLGYRG